METRDFKGIWIPKDIWENENLNALDKIILMEIDSLDTEDLGCFASNSYLADFCKCSETKVSLSIKKLIESDYIYVDSFDGRTRKLKSRLSKNERQPFKKCEADSQNMKANNIEEINSLINNKKESTKEKPTLEEVKAYCKERNNGVDAERWFNYYSANGWKVGKNPMKDWKAAVRTWERNGVGANTKLPTAPESSFDLEEFFERNRRRS